MTAQVPSEATRSPGILQDDVLAEVRNHIGHLTLNRPAGLNAITLDMVRSLAGYLRAWADDPNVHAVVLRGPVKKPSAPAATFARYTTATKAATACTKTSSSRNTHST